MLTLLADLPRPLRIPTTRIGWGCVIAFLTSLSALSHVAIASAQQTLPSPPPNGDFPGHYGPEIWFVIGGVLITIGINLEQLRRCRIDLQDLRKDLTERSNKFNSVDHRLQRIEDTLAFLKQGRRNDRDLMGLPLEEQHP